MQAHVFCRRLLLSVGRDHLGMLSRTILPFLNLCMRKSFLIGICSVLSLHMSCVSYHNWYEFICTQGLLYYKCTCSHLSPLAHTFIPSFLSQRCLSFGKKGCDIQDICIHILYRTEHSIVSYSLYVDQLCASVLLIFYCK